MAPAILARIVAASFFGVESIGLRAGGSSGGWESKAAEERGTKKIQRRAGFSSQEKRWLECTRVNGLEGGRVCNI